MIAPGLQAQSIPVWRMPNAVTFCTVLTGVAVGFLMLFSLLVFAHPITVSAGGGVVENRSIVDEILDLSLLDIEEVDLF